MSPFAVEDAYQHQLPAHSLYHIWCKMYTIRRTNSVGELAREKMLDPNSPKQAPAPALFP